MGEETTGELMPELFVLPRRLAFPLDVTVARDFFFNSATGGSFPFIVLVLDPYTEFIALSIGRLLIVAFSVFRRLLGGAAVLIIPSPTPLGP